MPWILRDEDIPYEESLLLDPYNETKWLEYIESTPDNEHRIGILDRAVATLPASTLLWNQYFEAVFLNKKLLKQVYRKALKALPESPSIWMKYLQLLTDNKTEQMKLVFDSALFNLPEAYHSDVWKLYLSYVASNWTRESRESTALVYIQFMQLSDADSKIELDVFEMMENILRGKSPEYTRELWRNIWLKKVSKTETPRNLAEYCLKSEALLASETELYEELIDDYILRYPNSKSETLRLKAKFYQSRDDDKARHFYSQSLSLANTVSEVVKAFDALVDFEDSRLEGLDETALSARLDILEHALSRRPFYINDVQLKASPNNVDIWLDRAAIFGDDKAGRIKTLVEAIMNINPLKATGSKSLVEIWDEYAKIYLDLGDLKTAILIYSKAANSQFKTPQELVAIHMSWTEALLQISDEAALEHIEDVLYNHIPNNHKQVKLTQATIPVQARLFKCTELWKFHIDLLKALIHDTNQELVWNKLHKAYQKMVELEVITLGLVLDYADFLKERGQRDRALSLYEEALKDFQSPVAQFELWTMYLKDVLDSSNKNIERIRDLFEQCLDGMPLPGHSVKEIFDMYIAFEKSNGLSMKSMNILEKAVSYYTQSYETPAIRYSKQELNKLVDDKFNFNVQLLDRVSALKDPQLMRTTLQRAVEDTQYTTPQILEVGLRFVEFEKALKEITRARLLLKHLALLGDPESHLQSGVWSTWEKFEAEYGSENQFKDMLRYKRHLRNLFAEEEQAKGESRPMGFIKGETKGGEVKQKASENPDAIDLDMDM